MLEQLSFHEETFAFKKQKPTKVPKKDPYLEISPENLKIIHLYSEGFSAEEISRKVKVEKTVKGKPKKIQVSRKAIETRISNVRVDVKAKNIVKLVKECTKRGLIN